MERSIKFSFLLILAFLVSTAGAANWTGVGMDNEWTNDDNWDSSYPTG